ncbi:MAG: hypothetical protein KGS61_12015 [Verrucomicrobia bacterium]|nr:hypothetical protein [Verrucomicrobiota bacterium]
MLGLIVAPILLAMSALCLLIVYALCPVGFWIMVAIVIGLFLEGLRLRAPQRHNLPICLEIRFVALSVDNDLDGSLHALIGRDAIRASNGPGDRCHDGPHL